MDSADGKNDDWKIVILEHDKGSEQIAKLIKDLWPDITEIEKIGNRLYYKKEIRNAIKKSVKSAKGQKVLTLYGYGGVHHYTYGLCTEIADKKSDCYTYFHFDKHTDFGYMGYLLGRDRNPIDCATFVSAILDDSNAKKLRYAGCSVCGKKIKTPYKEVSLYEFEREGKKAIEGLLADTTDDVYISIDLDFLEHSAISTGFGNGDVTLDQLLGSLDNIKNRKNIISADVLGYVPCSDKETDINSLITYARIAGKIIGKEIDVKKEYVERLMAE